MKRERINKSHELALFLSLITVFLFFCHCKIAKSVEPDMPNYPLQSWSTNYLGFMTTTYPTGTWMSSMNIMQPNQLTNLQATSAYEFPTQAYHWNYPGALPTSAGIYQFGNTLANAYPFPSQANIRMYSGTQWTIPSMNITAWANPLSNVSMNWLSNFGSMQQIYQFPNLAPGGWQTYYTSGDKNTYGCPCAE